MQRLKPSRTENRAAHRKHSKKLRPFLDAAELVIGKLKDDDQRKGLAKLDKRWRGYCEYYDLNNTKEFPNHDAFKISVNNYLNA